MIFNVFCIKIRSNLAPAKQFVPNKVPVQQQNKKEGNNQQKFTTTFCLIIAENPIRTIRQ